MTKPIQIRRDDVVQNIRDLAAITGRPITEIVNEAVRDKLERVRRLSGIEERRRRIDEHIRGFQESIAGKPFPTDHDFYDEDGFPT